MKDVFQDFIGIFSLDSSIFRTIGPFLFKPGFLAREYLNGKRKKYLSPVRLYLFMSIIFFFIASNLAVNSPGGLRNMNVSSSNDSIKEEVILDEEYIEALKNDTKNAVIENDSIFTDTSRDNRLRENAIKAMENQTLFIEDFFKNISYSLFVLMPLFALILQLLNIRRKRFYVEHLIFTLNVHSFALLVLTIIAVLKFLIKGNDDFVTILILVLPVYFLIGMKRFYEQKFWKILLKSIILGSIYLVMIMSAILGLVLLTVFRM